MREPRTHPGHLWKDRYETIRRMHAAGVKLVVSSDQGSTGTQIDELPLLMEFLTNQVAYTGCRGVTWRDWACRGGAGAGRPRGDTGAGETGRCGYRGWRPVSDMTAIRRVHTVIKDGETLVRDGAMLWPTRASRHSQGGNMADLSKDEVKSLGRAVGLDIDEPLLTEVTYNLNALRELLDSVNPPGLDQHEPLPIVPPHERLAHEQG